MQDCLTPPFCAGLRPFANAWSRQNLKVIANTARRMLPFNIAEWCQRAFPGLWRLEILNGQNATQLQPYPHVMAMG